MSKPTDDPPFTEAQIAAIRRIVREELAARDAEREATAPERAAEIREFLRRTSEHTRTPDT